ELTRLPGVRRVEIAGEVRRGLEVVERIDAVVSADSPAPVLEALAGLSGVREVVALAEDRAELRLASDLPATLRAVSDPLFAGALLHSTGSEAHLEALRGR